jgi:hypothetical protein
MSKALRRLAPIAFAFAAGLIAATPMPASAQLPAPAPQQSYPPSGYPSRNAACPRLEAQLAAFDRGGGDPGRAEQVRRVEDGANRQQAELDRLNAQARRTGCQGGGFFSLFSGQPPQCAPLNAQIQQARANLDRTLGELQQLQGNSSDRDGQRRSILVALAQNDCGPQYRAAAGQSRDLFDSLFGPGTVLNPEAPTGNTYRTICVRTCDGFYFPISYATMPTKFVDDERACQRLCPAAEVTLFSHRTGEDVAQAVSSSGRRYSELPNAFAYRKQFNPSCGCKATGQTWADALKQLDDQTVEQGDIVVTQERSKQLSQPQVDAQGKPIRAPARPGSAQGPAPALVNAPAATSGDEKPEAPGKRQVRTVGPTFLPAR